jgi:hypothetical protein
MTEPLHAFMDESGIHDGSPVVTVAMYVAQQPDWRAFVRDWNAEIRGAGLDRRRVKATALDARPLPHND